MDSLASALLKGRLQHHVPGLLVWGASGPPQQSKPSLHFALQRDVKPGWRVEKAMEGCQRQAGAEGAKGPHSGPSSLPSLLHGLEWCQREPVGDKWTPLHGLRIPAGYPTPLLAPPAPISDRLPVAPRALGKHPPLVGPAGPLSSSTTVEARHRLDMAFPLPLRLLLHGS